MVVLLIATIEVFSPKALDSSEDSADTNSVLGSLGKLSSMKKPLCASPFRALQPPEGLESGTLLAVRMPESVTNSIMSESIFPDVKRACAEANVPCPQSTICQAKQIQIGFGL